MPLKDCEVGGRPGYRWGDGPGAKCYLYTRGDEQSWRAAKRKAIRQGVAIDGSDAVNASLKKADWIDLVRPRDLPDAHLEVGDGETVTLARIDAEQRLLYGIVLEPNVEDTQGDVVTAEDVEAAAHRFMKLMRAEGGQTHDGRPRIIGLQHLASAPAAVTPETEPVPARP